MSSIDVPRLLLVVIAGLSAAAAIILLIRARKRNVRLRDTRSRYEKLLSACSAVSVIADEHGRVLEIDRGAAVRHGAFEIDAAVGSVLWESKRLPAALAAQLKAAVRQARASGQAHFAHDFADADRSHRINVSCAATVVPDAAAPQVLIVLADGSRELRLEHTLAQYAGVLAHSSDAIACVEYDGDGISVSWPDERQVDELYNGRIAACNDAYARLVGRSRWIEVAGHRVGEFLPRDAANVALANRFIRNAYRISGSDSRTISSNPDDSRPVLHLSWNAEVRNGRVLRSWCAFRDITDQVKAINARALAAERRESLQLAEEAYFCYEHNPPIDTSLPADEQVTQIMQGVLIECNAAYARFCGARRPDEIIGRTLAQLTAASVVGFDPAGVRARLCDFVESGYILDNALGELDLPDGGRLISLANGRGVVKNGRLTHHWAMLLDLTDREARLEDLKRSEARFERMAQNTPALIYRLRLDPVPEIEFVNDTIAEVTGYRRDHASIGEIAMRELFARENLALITAGIDSGASDPILTRHRHRTGHTVHLEHRVVPIYERNGKLGHIEGVALDVTDRLMAQQQLQTALSEISNLKDELQRENRLLRDEIRSTRSFELIVGNNPAFRLVVDLAARAAPTDSTILLMGETGTGKELFARSIHESSARNDAPLVCVNCAALPDTLIEGELFGHTEGAFTGAQSAREGRFQAADGGTLFLDEIGELSLDLQAKLLRVVQEGEFEPLGASETNKVDVRLIAATNADLAQLVETGRFRADLFYRLNVFPIVIPPLRERLDDVPILANHFAIKHSHRLGRRFQSLSAELLQSLTHHTWPGNVRELESAIERAIIVSAGDKLQSIELTRGHDDADTDLPGSARRPDPPERSLQEAERDYIVSMLERTDWVIEGALGAAARLGIAPSTLRSKMKKLGIERPQHGGYELPDRTQPRIH